MYLIAINHFHGSLNKVVAVTADRDLAKERFLATCAKVVENWEEYTETDINECLNEGFVEYGDGCVNLIDTDGVTSDQAIASEIKKLARPDMKITRWVNRGNLPECKRMNDLKEALAANLDASCACDIQGSPMFQTVDKRWWTVVTESMIVEADPDSVNQELGDDD